MNTKRSFNFLTALFAIMVFLPMGIFIGVLIYLEDRKKIFFIQTRIGMNRRTIRVIKFRTMHLDHITKVGRWLRPTGLDELPQFINVLKGEMSVVGPRPLTHADVCRLGWDTNRYLERWSVMPGITGLAQLFGGCSAAHSWQLDQKYLRRASLSIDAWLILLSCAVLIYGKKRIRNLVKGNFK